LTPEPAEVSKLALDQFALQYPAVLVDLTHLIDECSITLQYDTLFETKTNSVFHLTDRFEIGQAYHLPSVNQHLVSAQGD
jgi:hypothetical protein